MVCKTFWHCVLKWNTCISGNRCLQCSCYDMKTNVYKHSWWESMFKFKGHGDKWRMLLWKKMYWLVTNSNRTNYPPAISMSRVRFQVTTEKSTSTSFEVEVVLFEVISQPKHFPCQILDDKGWCSFWVRSDYNLLCQLFARNFKKMKWKVERKIALLNLNKIQFWTTFKFICLCKKETIHSFKAVAPNRTELRAARKCWLWSFRSL